MKVENGKWNVHVFTSARHRSGAELILLWWGRRNRPKQKLFGVQKESDEQNGSGDERPRATPCFWRVCPERKTEALAIL